MSETNGNGKIHRRRITTAEAVQLYDWLRRNKQHLESSCRSVPEVREQVLVALEFGDRVGESAISAAVKELGIDCIRKYTVKSQAEASICDRLKVAEQRLAELAERVQKLEREWGT